MSLAGNENGNAAAIFCETLPQHALSWINIEVLNLDQNQLTDAHLSHFAKMRFCKLKSLDLRDNLITDEGALTLIKGMLLKNLEDLNLWGNEIKKYKTAILLMKNTNWGSLKTFNLSYEKLAIEKLRTIKSFQQQESLPAYHISVRMFMS